MEQTKGMNLVPGPRAWLACALSTVLLLATCYMIMVWSDSWRRDATFDSLVESIDNRDYIRAQGLLKLLTEAPPSIAWLNKLSLFGAPPLSVKRRETAQKLLDLIVAISNPETNGLSHSIAVFEGEIYPWLSAHLKTESKQNSLLSIAVMLHEQFQDARGQLRELAAAKAELETLQSERRTLLSQYGLILGEFRELFSLKAPEEEPDEVQMAFYQSGILKDLPVIAQLPDNIADLGGLKILLEQTGGRVTTEGPNPQTAFAEQLAHLREAAAPILTDSQRNGARLEEVETTVDTLNGKIEQTRRQTASNLQRLLLFETRP